MANLRNIDAKAFGGLLATSKLDVSQKAAQNAAVGIPPDTHNRTILIGLGGTGIKTLEYIKGTIIERLDPTWKQYIAFLGIDADENEFEQCNYLTAEEQIVTTRPGVDDRAAHPQKYPKAWIPFVDPKAASNLTNLSGNGSGRKRLAGKMKIHDKEAGKIGVDEDIVKKLTKIKGGLPLYPGSNQKYAVYVIGSLIGGTCSGGFLEMPALVRRAINNPNLQINAILYLPDTMTAAHGQISDELEANGYASLKELNYFEGMFMRPGYRENWSYSDCGDISIDNDFFAMPYLIGSAGGSTPESEAKARETIAEFFISLLGKVDSSDGQNVFLLDSFMSNAMQHIGQAADDKPVSNANSNIEAPGSSHEFPKRFGTIGFAKAAAPQEIVFAYAVGEACKIAGLVPTDAATIAAKKLAGETLLPFRSAEDQLPASVGTQQSAAILQPLTSVLAQISMCAEFSYTEKFPGSDPSWENIRSGDADKIQQPTDQVVRQHVASLTNADVMKDKLKQDIGRALEGFKRNVKEYVRANGPFAFVNLFEGSFVAEHNNPGSGIKQMIMRIRDGKELFNDAPCKIETAADKKSDFDAAAKQIRQQDTGGLFGVVGDFVRGKRREHATAWVNAFNDYVNAQVQDAYRESLYGAKKLIERNFLEPAQTLAAQIRAFGEIITALSDAYHTHSGKLTDDDAFAGIADNTTEVNIAAVNPRAHAWLVGQASRVASTIDGKKVRDALINDFFKAPESWLEFSDDLIETTPTGEIRLRDPERPVPARKKFDACMRENITMNIDVSIKSLFDAMQKENISYGTFAQQTITSLVDKSKLLFNGDLSDKCFYRYIMYPQSLSVNEATRPIVTAIQQAATQAFPNCDLGFYGSGYADGIMMFQMAAPFELYHLKDLPLWEEQYEKKLSKSSCMHGRGPDLKEEVMPDGSKQYSEKYSWYDYPAITRTDGDPRVKDASTGRRSREGELRLAVDEVIAEARKLGVLYGQQDPEGWFVYRVFCDYSTDWKFDEDWMAGNEALGKDLAQVVATRNGRTLQDISRKVVLHFGGLFDKGADSEERAWERAARVLRAHVQMYNEVRETLEHFRKWGKALEEVIRLNQTKLYPAKMIRIMQAHLLYCNEDGIWKYTDESGNDYSVANMSDSALARLSTREPVSAAIVGAGFNLYYIYKKFMALFEGNSAVGDIDEAVKQAKQVFAEDADPDTLDESVDLTNKMLKEEVATLEGYGAVLGSPTRQKRSFFVKMADLDIDDEELASDICSFYSRAQLWKKVK